MQLKICHTENKLAISGDLKIHQLNSNSQIHFNHKLCKNTFTIKGSIIISSKIKYCLFCGGKI